MKLIRCLICNKVLGEIEGKAKIKCKMAGCHCMNVIDTDAGTQLMEAKWAEPDKEYKWIVGSNAESNCEQVGWTNKDIEDFKKTIM